MNKKDKLYQNIKIILFYQKREFKNYKFKIIARKTQKI